MSLLALATARAAREVLDQSNGPRSGTVISNWRNRQSGYLAVLTIRAIWKSVQTGKLARCFICAASWRASQSVTKALPNLATVAILKPRPNLVGRLPAAPSFCRLAVLDFRLVSSFWRLAVLDFRLARRVGDSLCTTVHCFPGGAVQVCCLIHAQLFQPSTGNDSTVCCKEKAA